ncbi:hypothetical protein H4R20_000639 [Coemansia guatemalensis]|uniref:Mitochondrial cytochrome c oxidase subunit VIa n=1 Tax=Coemansia guatemalensis TaxID=2761395 RepID=A0A9W8LV96_9FUNG|nr:hypothetical protein H4R20_000639 [Coemansia guatemalensis]
MFRTLQLARTAAVRNGAMRNVRLYSGNMYTREGYKAAQEHAKVAAETWRKISLYVAMPLCLIFGYVAVTDEMEHIHHLEHDPPTFVAYPYMHVRKCKFPFGDGEHTIFWNPLVNPDPE